jgi:hypothetical protein
MDKLIAGFIKKEDSLEERIQKHIDSRLKLLDLETIMQNPEAELMLFAEQVAEDVFKKFSTEAVLEGINFAEAVAKRKTEVNIEAKV